MASRRDHMEGIHAAGTHLSKCRLKFAAAEGAYGTFMGHQSAVVEAAAQGARREVSRLLESGNIPIQDLNYAIFQAAKRGHKYILQTLIDAGGTDLDAAMEAAGWSGHMHIVDELMLSGHVHIGRAFLGAMLACREDMIAHLISVADADGLESGLRVGASLIWSRAPEEVDFLSHVIDQLVKAGAKTFEDALLSSCNGTAILHLNGRSILQKSKIFDRLVSESSNLTKDFYNSLLLQACVCFLYRMTILEAGDAALVDHCDVSVFVCESVPFLPKVKRMQHILESGTATQDMLKIFSILFRNGIGLISSQLQVFVDVAIEKARALLQIGEPSQGGQQAAGAPSSRVCIESRAEWPLKMMKYLLTQCGVNSECAIEQAVASSTHLGVMLPVLELLVGCDCLAITDPYVVLAFATAFRQTAAIRYLLDIIPKPVNVRPMMEAFKTAASENIGPEGVLFLLHLNFLDDPKATLRAASMVAELEDTTPDLKLWLREEWSKEAYDAGVQTGSSHYLNLMRVIKRGQGRLCIRELPAQLQAAIGYLPLYKDCCKTPGTLLSQRQKGELVEALCHLYRGSRKVSEAEILRADKAKLLLLLGACLPEWSQLPANSDVRTPMTLCNNRI